MSNRTKGFIVGIVIVAAIVGLNFYNISNRLHISWSGDDLYDRFLTKAQEKYGNNGQRARMMMRENEYVKVFLCFPQDGDEAYYEIYQYDQKNPGEDLWVGPKKTGKITEKDGLYHVSMKIKNQETQQIYFSINSESASGLQISEGGQNQVISTKEGQPLVVITDADPEQVTEVSDFDMENQ